MENNDVQQNFHLVVEPNPITGLAEAIAQAHQQNERSRVSAYYDPITRQFAFQDTAIPNTFGVIVDVVHPNPKKNVELFQRDQPTVPWLIQSISGGEGETFDFRKEFDVMARQHNVDQVESYLRKRMEKGQTISDFRVRAPEIVGDFPPTKLLPLFKDILLDLEKRIKNEEPKKPEAPKWKRFLGLK